MKLQRLPRSYHVVVVDLPGHGDSSVPDSAANDEDVSMSPMLDSLREVSMHAIAILLLFG